MYNASLFSGGDATKIPGANVSSEDFKTRATNCALLSISIVCVCILVACGVIIVREYALGKDYLPTNCAFYNVSYSNDMSCMFCATGGKDKLNEKGKGACIVSRFPCVHIWVKYNMEGRRVVGLLHPDSLQAAGAYAKCSYDVCHKEAKENKDDVQSYANTWMEKSNPFECFYNTLDTDSVIVIKLHDKYDVIHSMLWPSVTICICGVIFLRLEMLRRGLTFCGTVTAAEGVVAKSTGSSSYQHGADRGHALIQIRHPPNGIDTPPVYKVVPNDQAKQLLLSHRRGSLDQLDQKGGGGGKGKKLTAADCSGGVVKSSRSADALRHHLAKPEDLGKCSKCNLSNCRQDSNCSSGSGHGHETPV